MADHSAPGTSGRPGPATWPGGTALTPMCLILQTTGPARRVAADRIGTAFGRALLCFFAMYRSLHPISMRPVTNSLCSVWVTRDSFP